MNHFLLNFENNGTQISLLLGESRLTMRFRTFSFDTLHLRISIKTDDVPEQKGFVRANVVVGGLRFETLSNEEIEEMQLPKLMVAVNEDGNVEEQNKDSISVAVGPRGMASKEVDQFGDVRFQQCADQRSQRFRHREEIGFMLS